MPPSVPAIEYPQQLSHIHDPIHEQPAPSAVLAQWFECEMAVRAVVTRAADRRRNRNRPAKPFGTRHQIEGMQTVEVAAVFFGLRQHIMVLLLLL